jgi:hypothetical protein
MGNQNPNIPGESGFSATSEGLPTPYDTNRVTPDNAGLGNQVGNALSDAGAVTAQIGAIEKKAKGDADMSAAVDAQTQLIRGSQTKFYGDGTDANPGFFSLEGQNAVAKSGGLVDSLEQDRQKIRDGLVNDEQKTAFDKLSIPHITSYREQVESYTQRQVKVAHQATYNASTETALQSVNNAARANDVDAVNVAMDRQRKIVAAEASTRGVVGKIPDPENPGQMIDNPAASAMQASWRKQATIAALQGFMSSDQPDDASSAAAAHLAQNFLNEHKADLGLDLKQWSDSVTSLKNHVDASVTTNNLMNDAKDPVTNRIDWAKVQARLDKMPEGNQKYAVEKLALERSIENSKFQDQRGAVIATQLATLGDPKNTGHFRMPSTPAALALRARLNVLDPKALENLDALQVREDRQALANERAQRSTATFEQRAEAAKLKAESITSSSNARVDLVDHPERYSGMTAEGYQKLVNDPSQFGPMSAADQKVAVQKFIDAQKSPAGKLTDQLVIDEMQAAGMKDKGKRAAAIAPISDSVQRWIDSERSHTNKTPGETQIREQIQKRLARGTVPGGGRVYGDANDVSEYEWEQETKLGGRFVGKPFVPAGPPASSAPAAAPAAASPAPTAPPMSVDPSSVPEVASKTERDKLPPGTQYRRKGDPTVYVVGGAK